MRTLLLLTLLGLLLSLSFGPSSSEDKFQCYKCFGVSDCSSPKPEPCLRGLKSCSKTKVNGDTTSKGCVLGGNVKCEDKPNAVCACDTSLCNGGKRSIDVGGGGVIFLGLAVLLGQRLFWE